MTELLELKDPPTICKINNYTSVRATPKSQLKNKILDFRDSYQAVRRSDFIEYVNTFFTYYNGVTML